MHDDFGNMYIPDTPSTLTFAGTTIQTDYPILQIIDKEGDSLIRIESNGTIFWEDREIESDNEFKSAMLLLAEHIRGITR